MHVDLELRGLFNRFMFAVADCGLRIAEVAPVVGLEPVALSELTNNRPPNARVESRIRLFVDLVDMATLIFGGRSEAGEWLRRPNPALLHQRAPIDLLAADSSALPNVRRLLEQQCIEANLIPAPSATSIWL